MRLQVARSYTPCRKVQECNCTSMNSQPARQMGNHAKTWQGLPPNCEPWPWLSNCKLCQLAFRSPHLSTLCTYTCWDISKHNASLLGSADDAASGSHNKSGTWSIKVTRVPDFVWFSSTLSGSFEITAEVLDPSIMQRKRFNAGSSCWGCTTTTTGRCFVNGTSTQKHQGLQAKQLKVNHIDIRTTVIKKSWMHSLSKIHGEFLRIHRSTQFCFFNSCSCCFYKIRVTSRSLSHPTILLVWPPQACPFQQFISVETSKKMNNFECFISFFEAVTSCITTWEASSGLSISLIVLQFKVQCWKKKTIQLLSEMRHQPNHGNIVQTASFEKRLQKFLNAWCNWFTCRIKVQSTNTSASASVVTARLQLTNILMNQQRKAVCISGRKCWWNANETKQISTGPCLPTWALALQ